MAVVKSVTLKDEEWRMAEYVKALLIGGGVLESNSDSNFIRFCIFRTCREILSMVGGKKEGENSAKGSPG
jgi:hypothetical protein